MSNKIEQCRADIKALKENLRKLQQEQRIPLGSSVYAETHGRLRKLLLVQCKASLFTLLCADHDYDEYVSYNGQMYSFSTETRNGKRTMSLEDLFQFPYKISKITDQNGKILWENGQ